VTFTGTTQWRCQASGIVRHGGRQSVRWRGRHTAETPISWVDPGRHDNPHITTRIRDGSRSKWPWSRHRDGDGQHDHARPARAPRVGHAAGGWVVAHLRVEPTRRARSPAHPHTRWRWPSAYSWSGLVSSGIGEQLSRSSWPRARSATAITSSVTASPKLATTRCPTEAARGFRHRAVPQLATGNKQKPSLTCGVGRARCAGVVAVEIHEVQWRRAAVSGGAGHRTAAGAGWYEPFVHLALARFQPNSTAGWSCRQSRAEWAAGFARAGRAATVV